MACLNWKGARCRPASNPLQLDTVAAPTPSSTGWEVDYLIKSASPYIRFLSKILLPMWEREQCFLMACQNSVESGLNWGFPYLKKKKCIHCVKSAFRRENVEHLKSYCFVFWDCWSGHFLNLLWGWNPLRFWDWLKTLPFRGLVSSLSSLINQQTRILFAEQRRNYVS